MGMEVISMTNQNSKSGTNSMAVPEAKSAMNRFKEEVASELGVNLKDVKVLKTKAGRAFFCVLSRKKPRQSYFFVLYS